MTLYRYYSQKWFGKYKKFISEKTALKWMAFTRVAYFFSAGTLFIAALNIGDNNPEESSSDESLGIPKIVDHDEAHKRARESGLNIGEIITYEIGKGIQIKPFDREQYYQQLEIEAYERAKQAQQKLIEEGKELPPNAIKLVK